MPDLASQWKAFTPEQRDEALGKMSPDQKQQLATALGYKGDSQAPPDDRNGFQKFADKAQTYVEHPEQRGAGQPNAANRFGGGVVESTLGVLAHPIKTAEGMVNSNFGPPEDTGVLGAAEIIGGPVARQLIGLVKSFRQDPARAAGDVVGGMALGEATGEVFGPMTEKLKSMVGNASDAARKGTQTVLGVGEKPIKTAVAKEADSASNAAKKAIKSNREAMAEHASDTEEVRAANKEAVRAQSKIEPTKEKLKTAGRELQAQIETARNNALKEGSTKYTTVNDELNPIPADMENVNRLYQEANSSLGETQVEPPLIKRLGTAIERGDSLTYKDMQGMYSELGKELSKGNLAGPTYHAYDVLHEGLGEDMQRIADSKGMGKQLTDARNYWRRMKQAFGKQYNPSDVGNTVLDKATGLGSEEDQANRVRLLGSFDNTIPQTVEHISNLRKGLESLPEPKPVRDAVKPIPAKPELDQVHAPEINTRELREKLLDRWTSGETTTNKYQVHRLLSGGLGSVIGFALGEGAGGLGALGAEIGGAVSYAFGPAAIAKLIETPAVREWITRPPAGELETLQQLPHADRIKIMDGLGKVVKSAQSRGIKVSPALATLVGVESVTGPKTQKLQQTADEQRTNSRR